MAKGAEEQPGFHPGFHGPVFQGPAGGINYRLRSESLPGMQERGEADLRVDHPVGQQFAQQLAQGQINGFWRLQQGDAGLGTVQKVVEVPAMRRGDVARAIFLLPNARHKRGHTGIAQ
jgi:hypothetical protein